MATIVRSNDEWSKLTEVIVGTPYHLDYHDDTSFRLFFHDNLSDPVNHGVFTRPNFKPNNRLKDECLEDIDGLLGLLEDAGVRVRRPQPLTSVRTTRTPGSEEPMGHALMPRDLFLLPDDEITETPPMVRPRYFETALYKDLLTEYFTEGARWTVAPKSRL